MNKFRSRISVLLTLVIVSILVPTIVPVFVECVSPIAIIIVLLPLIFISICFLSTKYIVRDNKLLVKSLGLTMAKIDIANICSINRSYNPISSPAISLKRLRVTFYTKGTTQSVLISPVRESEFVMLLKTINPRIIFKIYDKPGFWRFWNWDI